MVRKREIQTPPAAAHAEIAKVKVIEHYFTWPSTAYQTGSKYSPCIFCLTNLRYIYSYGC
jgi:hypothetical protein